MSKRLIRPISSSLTSLLYPTPPHRPSFLRHARLTHPDSPSYDPSYTVSGLPVKFQDVVEGWERVKGEENDSATAMDLLRDYITSGSASTSAAGGGITAAELEEAGRMKRGGLDKGGMWDAVDFILGSKGSPATEETRGIVSGEGSVAARTIESRMRTKLTSTYSPSHMSIANISHTHNVPPNSETHFTITIVSSAFDSMPRLKRHRHVLGNLQEYIDEGVHSVVIKAKTVEEWDGKEARGERCRGGDGSLRKRNEG